MGSGQFDQWLLMGLALGFYLLDSLLLLHVNEGALLATGQGGWRAAFGARRWQLAGREPYLPNPFTPHRRLFRLAWSLDGDLAAASEAAPVGRESLPQARLLGLLTLLSLACLFGALPCGLFWLGSAVSLWAAGALYTINLAIALSLIFGCRHWPVAPATRAMLAFESLVCPPLAINALRRLCARTALPDDLVGAARRLLSPQQVASALDACLLRVDEQLELHDDQSRDYAGLQATREQLSRLLASVAPRSPRQPV